MKFGPINLTWWRKRPSVHVAEPYNYTQVFDMSPLLHDLQSDRNSFLTMLMSASARRAVYPEIHHLMTIGDHVRDAKTGRHGRIVERRLKNPDDWFSLEREVVVEWDGASEEAKIAWLEDDFMPRLNAMNMRGSLV